MAKTSPDLIERSVAWCKKTVVSLGLVPQVWLGGGADGLSRTEHYLHGLGPRVGLFYPDGCFDICGLFEVVCRYGEDDQPIESGPRVMLAPPGTEIVIGQKRIFKRWWRLVRGRPERALDLAKGQNGFEAGR